MSKRRFSHQTPNSGPSRERWLVSYADLVTLMFAFFVVLYAVSQTDQKKLDSVSKSMKQAFGSGPIQGVDRGASPDIQPFDSRKPLPDVFVPRKNLPNQDNESSVKEVKELESIQVALEEVLNLELGTEQTSDTIQIRMTPEGLLLRFSVEEIYQEGMSELSRDIRPFVDRIGRVLVASDRKIRISGHAEKEEAERAGFPSSWELSSQRAAWLARYWQSRFQLDPERLSLVAYGHYRPVDGNSSSAKNRRIEILILKELL